jgi:hypothetical protein
MYEYWHEKSEISGTAHEPDLLSTTESSLKTRHMAMNVEFINVGQDPADEAFLEPGVEATKAGIEALGLRLFSITAPSILKPSQIPVIRLNLSVLILQPILTGMVP